MLPTLGGRVQTRIVTLVVLGAVVTLVATPVLPHDPALGDTSAVLATVLVLGVGWELAYHAIQQVRWEKDWPTLFGLLTAINEGALVYLLLYLELVPGIDGRVPYSTFVVHFATIWLVVWAWTNGPMRVPFIRWRFHGGRLV